MEALIGGVAAFRDNLISRRSDQASWTSKTNEQSVKSWTRFLRDVARADNALMALEEDAEDIIPFRCLMGVDSSTRGCSMFQPGLVARLGADRS